MEARHQSVTANLQLVITTDALKFALGQAIINSITHKHIPLSDASLKELAENYLAVLNLDLQQPSFSSDLLLDIVKNNNLSIEEKKYLDEAVKASKVAKEIPIGTYNKQFFSEDLLKLFLKYTPLHLVKSVEEGMAKVNEVLLEAYSYTHELNSQAFLLTNALALMKPIIGAKLQRDYTIAMKRYLLAPNSTLGQAQLDEFTRIIRVAVDSFRNIAQCKGEMIGNDWHAPMNFNLYQPKRENCELDKKEESITNTFKK